MLGWRKRQGHAFELGEGGGDCWANAFCFWNLCWLFCHCCVVPTSLLSVTLCRQLCPPYKSFRAHEWRFTRSLSHCHCSPLRYSSTQKHSSMAQLTRVKELKIHWHESITMRVVMAQIKYFMAQFGSEWSFLSGLYARMSLWERPTTREMKNQN